MDSNEQSMSPFVRLVMMFQIAALQQMGKLPNPLTNEIERDLQQAKASIDMLEMLEGKTKGNLTGTEKEFLDKVLFELRMDYVDESKRGAEEEKAAEKAGEGEDEGKKTEGNESATDNGGTASD